MAREWQGLPLGEVIELKRGYDLPTKDRRPGAIPVVSSSGITGRHDQAKARPPGVVTGRYGTLGKVYYMREPFWPLNTALYVRDFKGNHPRFIAYMLETLNYRAAVDKAAVPGVSRQHLHMFQVQVPPLEEQRAIAQVLGALDDKIELNRRMNRTLEAMARAIFGSWFVDFDPVIDNALRAGNPIPDEFAERAAARQASLDAGKPVVPDHIARLFPNAFEDSELGPVPARWQVMPLGDVCSFEYGKGLRAKDRRPGPVAVVGSNGQVGWHDKALVEGPGIVVGRKGNPGTVTWIRTDFFPIDTTFYVLPRKKSVSLLYLRYALERLGLQSLGSDSAVPGLNRNIAYMSLMLVPSSNVLGPLETQVGPLLKHTHACELESRTLAALRDALLPKLLSGEIRVQNAADWDAEDGLPDNQ